MNWNLEKKIKGNNVGYNVFMFFELQETLSVDAHRKSAVLKFVSISDYIYYVANEQAS